MLSATPASANNPLIVLSLVGCISTSPGIPDLYLVKLEDVKTNASVRVGYFGMVHKPSL